MADTHREGLLWFLGTPSGCGRGNLISVGHPIRARRRPSLIGLSDGFQAPILQTTATK